jgi:hypothetical protein
MASDESIRPRELQRLSGDEVLGPATVRDFWRWALGDLRMNNARGYLVEFLVAQALGDSAPMRVEWGGFDVRAEDGTRVEVKTTGRLQSWTLKRLSTPAWSFKSVRASRVWSEELGDYVTVDPYDRVHVWVFALQTAEDAMLYDPLNLKQWEFRVVPHRQLLATGQTSGRLALFERLGISPVTYKDMPSAVAAARESNDALGTST